MRRLATTALAAPLLLALALAPASADAQPSPRSGATAVSADSYAGKYVSVPPQRFYDSRRSGGALRSGTTRKVQIAGRGGVGAPYELRSVVINLTVTGATAGGYLVAYPTGRSTSTSSVNFVKGETRASLVTVPVAPDGTITIRSSVAAGGSAQVVVDVQGWYQTEAENVFRASSDFFPFDPERIADTRTDGGGALAPGDALGFELDLGSDEENDATSAILVNATAVAPRAGGYLVAWDDVDTAPPSTSNVSFAAGRTTPNNVVVPVTHADGADGERVVRFAIGNGSRGSVDLLTDVLGAYATDMQGLRLESLSSPVRVLDTRAHRGGFGALGPRSTGTVVPPASVSTSDTFALVGSLTAVDPSATGFLTTFASGSPRPDVSNLNPARGQTVANHDVVGLGPDGRFRVYNAAGRTDVLFDVSGRFVLPEADSSARRPAAAPSATRSLRVEYAVQHVSLERR